MPTTVHLIRHGETAANRAHRVQGRGIDLPLNAVGQAQADAVAAALADVPLTAVVSSPLVRARQTAEAIAQHHGLDVETDADLEEIGWGVIEGDPDTDVTAAAFARLYAAWGAGDFDVRVEGGESVREVQARVLGAWDRMLARHAGGTVALVSHGRTIRVLLASVLHRDAAEPLVRMHDYGHANTSRNVLVVDDDGHIVAERLNCTAHLSGDIAALPHPATGMFARDGSPLQQRPRDAASAEVRR